MRWMVLPMTCAPAVSARRWSSPRCSSTCNASSEPFRGAPTRKARSVGAWISINRRVTAPAFSEARFLYSSVLRRSEEHTSELQSQSNLVCRLLLEKKKQNDDRPNEREDVLHQQTP